MAYSAEIYPFVSTLWGSTLHRTPCQYPKIVWIFDRWVLHSDLTYRHLILLAFHWHKEILNYIDFHAKKFAPQYHASYPIWFSAWIYTFTYKKMHCVFTQLVKVKRVMRKILTKCYIAILPRNTSMFAIYLLDVTAFGNSLKKLFKGRLQHSVMRPRRISR